MLGKRLLGGSLLLCDVFDKLDEVCALMDVNFIIILEAIFRKHESPSMNPH